LQCHQSPAESSKPYLDALSECDPPGAQKKRGLRIEPGTPFRYSLSNRFNDTSAAPEPGSPVNNGKR